MTRSSPRATPLPCGGTAPTTAFPTASTARSRVRSRWRGAAERSTPSVRSPRRVHATVDARRAGTAASRGDGVDRASVRGSRVSSRRCGPRGRSDTRSRRSSGTSRWRRDDGQLFDPWMRIHERPVPGWPRPLPRSLRITGTVAEWESWTGLAFPESADYVFPEGLATVHIDREADRGSYWERGTSRFFARHRVIRSLARAKVTGRQQAGAGAAVGDAVRRPRRVAEHGPAGGLRLRRAPRRGVAAYLAARSSAARSRWARAGPRGFVEPLEQEPQRLPVGAASRENSGEATATAARRWRFPRTRTPRRTRPRGCPGTPGRPCWRCRRRGPAAPVGWRRDG